MPIKMVTKKIKKRDLLCPVVICDYCHEEITDAKDGNFEWQFSPPSTGEVFFTHKKCCYPFEKTNGGRAGWAADELQVFPLYLANNLEIDSKAAEELARMMSQI